MAIEGSPAETEGSGRRSLASLAIGQEAIVRRFHLPRPMARRLLELGLLPGTRVRVVRHAPLGDPIELRLRNYALSIGREEASRIDVEPLPTPVLNPATR
jgi:Fe2+ transport system protein FeoA